MISAMTPQRVIGTGTGGIPWHLPKDARHFRDYTAGRHMLLGRRTYEEMSGWFKTQIPIILTRSTDYQPELGLVASSVEDAIQIAREAGEEELVISGGGSIYEAGLPFADKLIVTWVETEVDSEVRFPDFQAQGNWQEVESEEVAADHENQFAMRFVTYQRV